MFARLVVVVILPGKTYRARRLRFVRLNPAIRTRFARRFAVVVLPSALFAWLATVDFVVVGILVPPGNARRALRLRSLRRMRAGHARSAAALAAGAGPARPEPGVGRFGALRSHVLCNIRRSAVLALGFPVASGGHPRPSHARITVHLGPNSLAAPTRNALVAIGFHEVASEARYNTVGHGRTFTNGIDRALRADSCHILLRV